MLIKQVNIKNFRGIEELSFPLDDLCVLIGENNAGKSSILDALRLCLTRSLTRRGNVFEDYDYHMPDASADPARANPIEITLTFEEQNENEWADEISQLLSDAEQVSDAGLRSVILRVTSNFDAATNDYATNYDFLDLSGNPLVRAKNPRLLISLQQLVPTFYLASLRDAAREFRAKSQFWGPFVRALELDDIARAEIEQALLELNSKVLAQHTAFDSVKDKIKKIADLLPLSDNNPVSIEAVPSKVFDILSRTQVNLASKTGAQIPIVRHGSGTQNLAVICLFEAFLESRLENGFGKYAEPFLTLEEPEAHLHPSAIKAVGKMLNKLSGQKLISTHSGELLAGVPLSKICRLRRRNGKIAAYRIGKGKLSSEELSKLDYHIRAKRGGLLFSRCWLLVEGETETLLLSECGHAMGRDLYADGISCIEYSQVGVEKFIKLADLLGIEWFVLADNDNAGKKYKKSAQDLLGEREGKDRIRLLDHGSMEEFLCEEGFGEIYKASISERKKDNVTAKIGTDEYWKQVLSSQKKGAKTRNALVIAEEIVEQGKSAVPNLLKDVIERAQSLARSVS